MIIMVIIYLLVLLANPISSLLIVQLDNSPNKLVISEFIKLLSPLIKVFSILPINQKILVIRFFESANLFDFLYLFPNLLQKKNLDFWCLFCLSENYEKTWL